MAKKSEKDFNKQLNDNKDMPKIIVLTEAEAIKRYGGEKMLIAPPLFYDEIMKQIPSGKLITTTEIREKLAHDNGADYTCQLTAGIFVTIAANASEQRNEDKTPYWRTLKANGELNPKYPGGIESQCEKLKSEGHKIIQKGRTNIRCFVENYEDCLFDLSK